ncbi:MAG TPA: hypothetical protein VJ843_03955 [Candidatus Saccharimonadales bacterium]|nr:hypothetical protein [Candidatus Saccharimonadales bacterium]
MTEKYSLRTTNKVAILGGAVALGLFLAANQSNPTDAPEESNTPLPDARYAIVKDCVQNPDAYQKFTLATGQHLYITAGLKHGKLKNQDVLTINGNSQQLTVTPYGQEDRTVFPDKLTPKLVEEFPFDTLGSVAIGQLNGDASPSVILACDLQALTEPGQPLAGQMIDMMPPMQ